MQIRLAKQEDLEAMLSIYEHARSSMRKNGNPTQWGNSYPQRDILENDIHQKHSYVMVSEDGDIYGTFMFMIGEEPNYKRIDNGTWLNDKPYGVIHRVASDGRTKGVLRDIVRFCRNRCENLRIDTHADNKIMQYLLEKNGFVRCGTVYMEDGSARIAYQSFRDEKI